MGFAAEKYMNFSVQKIMYFGAEKSYIFPCGKISYFSVQKNNIFFCVKKSGIFVGRPVLDTGQWTARDAGQWTEGLSSSGQWDTGRAVLYWTEAARDSWTVDGTEWTELLSLL